jgi:DNA-binding NarL/FixJ family response regulator
MDARFVSDVLADARGRFSVEHVKNLKQAKASLADGQIDVALVDLNLPDSKSLNTCFSVLEQAPNVPIVVYTSEANEEAAIKVVHRGAQDYIIKGDVSRSQLIRAIYLAVARHTWRKPPNSQPGTSIDSLQLRPHWNVATRELTAGGVLVKSFQQHSPNQFAILAAFEEEAWPKKIDDPLRREGIVDPKERLRATIKSLNRRQRQKLVRFFGDGTGKGVAWQMLGVQ